MKRPPVVCPGPVSRRHLLQIGSLALGSWTIGGLQPLSLTAGTTDKPTSDTSVIFIWLPGGPPHMETFDMKPEAPVEFRGDFKPIKTNVPGIEICEHLPLLARTADRYTLIRSIAHNFSDHGGGHKRFLTGRDPMSPVGFVNDHPMVGSMVSRVRETRQVGIPNYISGTDGGRDGIDVFSFGAAYLGPSTHPFSVVGDPASPRFEVKNVSISASINRDRFQDRLDLLGGLEKTPPGLSRESAEALDHNKDKALRMISTDTARKAFDLSREPVTVRERYGMHVWGQRALLARRLVEFGASFVTMVMENPFQSGVPFPSDGTYNWDSHAVNCHIFNDAKVRFPLFDKAISVLVQDLYERGLDKKTLLIVTGEFGRTPRISYAKDRPGRDHWPQAMSVLLAGGGIKTGQVIGSTNSRGEQPRDRPMTPNDLWATMFRHLDIDYNNTSFLDHTGRPMPMLPYGEPIEDLY